MKNSQRKIGIILSYLQMGLSIVIGLVYTPIMIRLMGQSEYGLYNTVASTISMLSILSLGFGNAYIKGYARYKKNNNVQGIYRLNGMFLHIFMGIGLIALICGLFLSFHLEMVFETGLTSGEYQIARILMILLTINLARSFPMSVFSNIISANERFVFLKLIGMLQTVVGPLVMLPLLFMGYRSIAMVVVSLVVGVVVDIINFIYVKCVLKNKFLFHGFEKGLLREMFAFSFFIAVNLIVDQINWNVDKFLLGRFKGTIAVAVYSVGYSLFQYYMIFSTSISGVFTPGIYAIINETEGDIKRRRKELTSLFVKVGRVQYLVLGLLATGLIFFGQPFITLWAGSEYRMSYYVMLLLVLPGTVALIQNCGIEIQRAENKHQFRSIVYIVMALINLVLSIWLCQSYGVVGCAVGTAVSLIIANGLLMNIYYHKKCNIDMICFWKNIFRVSRGLVIPIICGILIVRYVDLFSLWKMFFCIILYTGIYCVSEWLFGMNDYEKELIRKPLRNIVKKTNNDGLC